MKVFKKKTEGANSGSSEQLPPQEQTQPHAPEAGDGVKLIFKGKGVYHGHDKLHAGSGCGGFSVAKDETVTVSEATADRLTKDFPNDWEIA